MPHIPAVRTSPCCGLFAPLFSLHSAWSPPTFLVVSSWDSSGARKTVFLLRISQHPEHRAAQKVTGILEMESFWPASGHHCPMAEPLRQWLPLAKPRCGLWILLHMPLLGSHYNSIRNDVRPKDCAHLGKDVCRTVRLKFLGFHAGRHS